MCPPQLFERYQDLQVYLSWSEADRKNVVSLASHVEPNLTMLVDDFYAEIHRHPQVSQVLTGGESQVLRLKGTLRNWLQELFQGQYDLEYVEKRWRVGMRHAEIGLDQVYTNMALGRLRTGIQRILRKIELPGQQLWSLSESLNKLLDLDLAIIENSYESHRLQLETLAEKERSERKFRNLVEAAACMIVILREDFRVIYFSPYAERLSGYLTDDVVGESFVELFFESDAQLNSAGGWLGGDVELPINDVDMPIRCRDGSERWLVWNALRLEDFDGATAVLAVGHDITEKRRSAERLLQAERLAAIGQTITGLTHESRNALQRINSCTAMLEFEVEDNPDAMQLIHRSQQAQDDLARLFDEVRNFAAPISLEVATCSVAKVWREAWGLVQPSCQGRDVSLHEQTDGDDDAVRLDRFRMVQVFRNLFENSLAASGGPIRVDVLCRTLPVASARTAIPDPGVDSREAPVEWVEIRVRDNGPGLDPRARRDVFKPFFTTKTKGTGLGMAIAHRILEAHGGSIVVDESDRRGAEFVIRLPTDSRDPHPADRRGG